MSAWKYIKGGKSDFEGAPDWCTCVMIFEGQVLFEEHAEAKIGLSRWQEEGWGSVNTWDENTKAGGEIIAQRERVTSVNDDRLARPRSIVKPDGGIDFGCIQTPLVDDNINHPLRYTKGDVECIDAIKAATVGKTGIEAVDVGHVIRYLWRYEEKDGLESVKKAQWYIEHLIKQLESK